MITIGLRSLTNLNEINDAPDITIYFMHGVGHESATFKTILNKSSYVPCEITNGDKRRKSNAKQVVVLSLFSVLQFRLSVSTSRIENQEMTFE